jgi:glutamate synthase domain-containing protein 1
MQIQTLTAWHGLCNIVSRILKMEETMEQKLKMAKVIGTQKAYASFTEISLESTLKVYREQMSPNAVEAFEAVLREHQEQIKKIQDIENENQIQKLA